MYVVFEHRWLAVTRSSTVRCKGASLRVRSDVVSTRQAGRMEVLTMLVEFMLDQDEEKTGFAACSITENEHFASYPSTAR